MPGSRLKSTSPLVRSVRGWRRAAALTVLVTTSAASAQAPPGSANKAPATTRTIPTWFADAKLGIFVHWGAYSVPAFAPPLTLADTAGFDWSRAMVNNPYAEWYLNTMKLADSPTRRRHIATYGESYDYLNFIPEFDRQSLKWRPDEWATLFQKVGARYVVLTTKHHDGFLLWPSAVVNPNRPAAILHTTRDIVGELTAAVRKRGMKMGLYYSGGLDWSFNPTAIETTAMIRETIPQSDEYARYADRQWRELIDRYHPSILWNDIGYPRAGRSEEIVAEFYRRTPDGVVNNRWGNRLGDYLTPEYQDVRETLPGKWEACRGIGFSFGYNAAERAEHLLTADQLITLFVDIVSKNGNLLLDVGPAADGSISDLQLERLTALGQWLQANGEGIYGARPWRQAEGKTEDGRPVRYTSRRRTLYAFILGPATASSATLPDIPFATVKRARVLGRPGSLALSRSGGALSVTLPARPTRPGPLGVAIDLR